MRANALLAVTIWALAFKARGVTEEDGVLILDEKSFKDAVATNPFMLVMFYAPWCGHCKQLLPDYINAAKHLKGATPAVLLAKVDATAEAKLADEFGVRGFPSLKLFLDGRPIEYTGGRTEQSITTWVLKKVGPPAVMLEDVASADRFSAENKLAVIGFFNDGEDPNRVAFETTARQMEDIMFAYTSSPAVVQRYGIASTPSVKMVFQHDELSATYAGDFTNVAAIETFVKIHRIPLVSTFTAEIAADLFADGRPILFLFHDVGEKGEAAEKALRQAAPGLKREVLISIAGSTEPMDQRLMDYLSLEPEELPQIRYVSNPTDKMIKYKLDGDITADSITSFVRNVEDGRVSAHLKSEDTPTTQPGPIYTLVGSTFESIVKDPSKDVLVEFYAPWCGHCKKLEPIYRDVAKKLEKVGSLVVAKIDATANDVEGIDVEGFPTIKLWPANKKDTPLDYDADRDAASFITWLAQKVSIPFSPEELRNEL